MGRVTYQEMAQHWPTSSDAYAVPMNELPKVVFSKTLERADWPDSRIARGDLADEIATLTHEAGGDIIAWGGATFLQSLRASVWWMNTAWSSTRWRLATGSRCSRSCPPHCNSSWSRRPHTPRAPPSSTSTGQSLRAGRQRMCMPEIAREMTRRWISEVPSKIV
jgi:hypothetical protein